ncbi:MAG: hypothetical protein JW891_08080 [Candidatus Lokiarchaeota archaeon]|nr:hypothetical protein [Candidatus Lokiarchaeota archaeon]
MKERGWKKDVTPYFVFCCFKCNNYSLVKTTQKRKKCLRCGHFHIVTQLESTSEVIKGATAARKRLIELQNSLSLKETGRLPDFSADGDYSISNSSNFDNIYSNKELTKYDFFKMVLRKLDQRFKRFPEHVIYMLAEDHGISKEKVKRFIDICFREGFLKKTQEDLFYIQK